MAAGLSLTDIRPGERPADSTVPNSYQEHLVFTVTEVAPNGGQVFVCDTKKNCDALVAYFNALIAQIGPYVYQSPTGTVVVQLHSNLRADRAAQFEQVVAAL